MFPVQGCPPDAAVTGRFRARRALPVPTRSTSLALCCLGLALAASGCGTVVEPALGQQPAAVERTAATAAPDDGVPAPGGGDISEEVTVTEQEVLDPVELTEEVSVEGVVTAELLEVTHSTKRARIAGEIGGDAVRVRVGLSNGSSTPVDLDGATVSVHDGDVPLSPLYGDPAVPLGGALEPGDEVEGTYYFTLPEGTLEEHLTIGVSYAADAPVAVFVGDLR